MTSARWQWIESEGDEVEPAQPRTGRPAVMQIVRPVTTDWLNARSHDTLAGMFGIVIEQAESGLIESRLVLRPEFMAPNGYLHAATVVALADTSCGYGTVASLPEGATGFTTIELKSNHLGTASEGAITCVARMAHGGRRTQVWDAGVRDAASGAVIALFRCTQMVLY